MTTSAWKPLDGNPAHPATRWQYVGDTDRHLLLHQADTLVELHADTIHVYTAPTTINTTSPLTGAAWQRSLVVIEQTAGEKPPPAQFGEIVADLSSDTAAWTVLEQAATT
jgi:hypothetical protein